MEGPESQHNSDYDEYRRVIGRARRAEALAWLRPPYTFLDVALAVVALATLGVAIVWTTVELARSDMNRAVPLGVCAVALAVSVVAGPSILERFLPRAGVVWVALLTGLVLGGGLFAVANGDYAVAAMSPAALAVVTACAARHRSLFSLPSPPLSSTKGTNR